MKVTGDGNSKPLSPEEELPIDINYAKFTDWLMDRQKIKHDWRVGLRAIQEKVGTAIENLPDNEVLNAVKGTINVKEINYFTVKKIRDVLTSEKDTAQKNWLGQYKSQATKDWQAILALYHKDNIHLAEAAQIMVQNVQFEVPALRKIVQNCVKAQQELHRKEGEYKRGAEEFRTRYAKECAKLGIQGKEVKKELLQRSECLPSLYLEMAEALRSEQVAKACALYASFVEYSTPKAHPAGRALLPTLAAVHDGDLPTLAQMEVSSPSLLCEPRKVPVNRGLAPPE
ncbi:hypothetical protein T484DRAFT_2391319 [Baffinella frigidus]|nr:hypothetical protein T484DRAFT_2391319 [Cryptophyta sp. CCMP2293]